MNVKFGGVGLIGSITFLISQSISIALEVSAHGLIELAGLIKFGIIIYPYSNDY